MKEGGRKKDTTSTDNVEETLLFSVYVYTENERDIHFHPKQKGLKSLDVVSNETAVDDRHQEKKERKDIREETATVLFSDVGDDDHHQQYVTRRERHMKLSCTDYKNWTNTVICVCFLLFFVQNRGERVKDENVLTPVTQVKKIVVSNLMMMMPQGFLT